MHIAITGGTGFIGQAVIDEALAQGHTLRALTRRAQPERAGVKWIGGDLADVDALDRLVAGTDAVLHVAGVVNAAKAEGFVAANVRGTQRITAAARQAQVSRFILVSSLAAREPALSDYGRSKREGERIVEASALDWTIVRPPAVYGPRDTEVFELFKVARWGVVPVPRGGRTSILHVADLATLLAALLPGGAQVSGRIFEPDDARPGGWTHEEFARAIGEAVGRQVRTPSIAPGLFTAAAWLDRFARRDAAKLTPDRARYMVHPDWVSSASRQVPEERWKARVTGERGLRETADWYREQGWL